MKSYPFQYCPAILVFKVAGSNSHEAWQPRQPARPCLSRAAWSGVGCGHVKGAEEHAAGGAACVVGGRARRIDSQLATRRQPDVAAREASSVTEASSRLNPVPRASRPSASGRRTRTAYFVASPSHSPVPLQAPPEYQGASFADRPWPRSCMSKVLRQSVCT